MTMDIKSEPSPQYTPATETSESSEPPAPLPTKGKKKSKDKDKDDGATSKRRCVSTACIACRKRKSKCDGNLPKCAACASVYLTECEYAPHTDHRRKGVYKKEVDSSKAKNSTLQILMQAILNADEDDVLDLVRQIRSCESLEDLAASIEAQEKGLLEESADSPVYADDPVVPQFEAELSGKMGDLMLDGSVKFIGGTSNLIWLPQDYDLRGSVSSSAVNVVRPREEAILSWTTVTQDKVLILHFMNMYFCWHYAFFTTLSKELFYRDFLAGTPSQYCSSLLVNVMLALGCHFSLKPEARADPDDAGTMGDHYFAEAKRLLYEDDEFANAKICTVQALALMSVREAGCGHESKGWVYSGMSFRMACDLGLNVDAAPINESSRLTDEDIDARRITFWGCFLFDKCWSNYLGRQPQLQMPNITVRKPDVFPSEDGEMWSPYTDSGVIRAHAQPARTRAVALQLSKLAEISSDLLTSFYNPRQMDKPLTKQAELKRLSDVHTRLEAWKQNLPAEMEPKEGQLPQVLLMHMFFQLLYMHLYRPFLKYTRSTSPLPAHISPRKYCTQAAGAVAKLLRLYKRTHGLRQICNIAIYIAHSACTIHLLNLPDKNARRDIVHGVKHLEEMGECWTAARRTLGVLELCAQRWNIEMPDEAETVFTKARAKWGVAAGGSPISPQSMANMAKQIASQPLPDLMARNVQYQRQQQQPQRPKNGVAFQNTNPAVPVPSPTTDTVDPRRSSSGFSMPAQAEDVTPNVHRARPSTTTTNFAQAPAQQGRQDNWSGARHARMPSAASALAAPPPATAAVAPTSADHPAVDGLLEETQDWFFRDQNQLAMGFENWGLEPPQEQDWGTLDLAFFGGGAGDGATASQVNSTDDSPAYNAADGGGMHYYDGNSGGHMAHAYGGGPYPQNDTYDTQTMGMDMNAMANPHFDDLGMGIGMDLGGLNMGGAHHGGGLANTTTANTGLKRSMQSQDMAFDDDDLYY